MIKKLLYISTAVFILIGCDNSVRDDKGSIISDRDNITRASHVSMEALDWKKSYSNDRMAGLITLGKDGAFYTATTLHMGTNSPTMKIFKTDSRGKEIWSKRISLEIGENKVLFLSFGGDMKTDKEGNLLVVGSSSDLGEQTNDEGKSHMTYLPETHKAFFVKIDQNGEKLWEYYYEGGEIESLGKSVDMDSEGNYYVCGVETDANHDKRTFVVKLTADGREVYVKRYPLGGNLISKNSIIVSGNHFYILGNTSHLVSDGNVNRYTQDIGVIKATLDGEQIWEKSYEEGEYNFWLAGFTQDSHQNLVIATTRTNVHIGNIDATIYLLKITPEGQKLWVQSFGTGLPGKDFSESALDVEVDSKDNIFVSGWTRGAFPGYSNEHGMDPFLVKLSTNGKILKIAQFAAKEGSRGNAVTIDENDAVYLSGFGKLEGQNKYSFLIKYK